MISPDLKEKRLETSGLARQKIEEHINDAELDSTRFQAFADYVDFKEAQFWCSDGGNFSMFEARLILIEETIRQRTNQVRGYRREFKHTEHLHDSLRKSTTYDGPYRIGKLPQDIKYLRDLKNEAIEKRLNSHKSNHH